MVKEVAWSGLESTFVCWSKQEANTRKQDKGGKSYCDIHSEAPGEKYKCGISLTVGS